MQSIISNLQVFIRLPEYFAIISISQIHPIPVINNTESKITVEKLSIKVATSSNSLNPFNMASDRALDEPEAAVETDIAMLLLLLLLFLLLLLVIELKNETNLLNVFYKFYKFL